MKKKFVIVSFTFYSIVLVVFSLILLPFIAYSPVLILLGAIPNGLAYSVIRLIKMAILPVLCECFAIYIWIKVFDQIETLKSDINPEFKKNIVYMYILTIILSLAIILVGKEVFLKQ